MAKRSKSKSTSARPVLQFRVHPYLYERIKKLADDRKLTISEAAADILSNALQDKELFPGIQQMMMLVSGAFWHAGKMAAVSAGISHDYHMAGDWLRDKDCYRTAAVAAAVNLLSSGPIGSAPDVKKTLDSVSQALGR